MKIERDKWYVLQNGQKVRCICIDRPDSTYPILCLRDNGNLTAHRADGSGAPAERSIVSEYTPPPPLAECWVNFYDDSGPHLAHPKEEQAKQEASSDAIRVAVHMREVRDEK